MCNKLGAAVSPRCTTLLDYSEDLYLQYSFGREYLKDWRSIHDAIAGLVRSFENRAVSFPWR